MLRPFTDLRRHRLTLRTFIPNLMPNAMPVCKLNLHFDKFTCRFNFRIGRSPFKQILAVLNHVTHDFKMGIIAGSRLNAREIRSDTTDTRVYIIAYKTRAIRLPISQDSTPRNKASTTRVTRARSSGF